MLFIDFKFIFLFLPLFLLGNFFLAKNTKFSIGLILLFSLIFHGMYSIKATLLLCFSLSMNYFFVNRIYQNKIILFISLIFNLVILFFFKYVGFFSDILEDLFGFQTPRYHPALPLGISFFTFTQIACLVDSYQDQQRKSFLNYSAFVSYFPHLIAGPIIHYKPMITQFLGKSIRKFNIETFRSGIILFAVGFAKKTILADTIAAYINPIFNGLEPSIALSSLDAWMLALGYTFQLYFDFSGYTDMAIGISRMINVELPKNFNAPYLCTNLIDFWRRWHISLSLFLKDYLYIPLGGNQKGSLRRYINLLITMILGGIWHGAGYTYVVWGLYHGIGLTFNHMMRSVNIRLPKFISWLLTFLFVIHGWVIFRSPDLRTASYLLKSMYTRSEVGVTLPKHSFFLIILIIIGYFGAYFFRPIILTRPQEVNSLVLSLRFPRIVLFCAGILFAIALIMTTNDSPFLYFQF